MEWMIKIRETFLLLFLAVGAIKDQLCGKIDIWFLATGGVIGVLLGFLSGSGVTNMLSGVLVGALVLLISFMSREAIGYGDGLMVLVTGIFLGGIRNIVLFLTSLILCAVCGGIMIAVRLKKRSDRIAFIPFIFIGYIFLLAVY